MSELRQLNTNDADELRRLLRVCWLDTYTGLLPDSAIQAAITTWQSREAILRGLQNPQTYYAGYFDEGTLAGMVSAGMVDAQTLRIYQLYVLPSNQRRGIGSKLMEAAIKHFRGAKKVVLEVEDGNAKGISFYRKYGFSFLGRSVVEIGRERIPCLVGELNL